MNGQSDNDLRIQQRLEREQRTRHKVECLLEEKSRDLVEANRKLRELARHLADREAQTRSILEAVNDGIIAIDEQGMIESANPATLTLFGYPPDELIGSRADRLLAEEQGHEPDERIAQVFAGVGMNCSGSQSLEAIGQRKDGTKFHMEVSCSEALLEGRHLGILVLRDVSHCKQAEEQIRFLAYYDGLTELPNRLLFTDRANQAMASAKRDGSYVVFMFMDLDRFKRVNDTLGHKAGDELLKQAAQRIQGAIRTTDSIARMGSQQEEWTVARLGGDEFVILLVDVKDPGVVMNIAERVVQVMSKPFLIDGNEVITTASVGITLYPSDGEDLETLLINADTAMYHAKGEGRNRVSFYEPTMNEMAMERLQMENDLHRALEKGEFEVFYQPQVTTIEHEIIGVEALVRWNPPGRNWVRPDEFLPLADELGLVGRISEWVLHESCRQLKAWHDQGLPPIRVAVNVPDSMFRDRELVSKVAAVLEETGLEARYLELELTESIVMTNADSAIQTLGALKKMGIQLSVDDFGTGYSSLAYLKRLPLDMLKIDRSFIEDLPGDADDCAIVQAIIALARSLKMKVIAEGVERTDQETFVHEHGCSLIQGYLFTPPVPADEARLLIELLSGKDIHGLDDA